jgi:hypothetical protein
VIRILFLGDIVGRPGREAIRLNLPQLRSEFNLDFVVSNVENATHGKGLSHSHYLELVQTGIDVMTLGNHYAAQPELKHYISDTLNLLRPANIKSSYPGIGSSVYSVKGRSIRITNLLGQAFMHEEVHNPFDTLETIVQSLAPTDIHLVDFHAETTGEKMALAYAFDGRITGLVGTHTHIQTADERILPSGTAYLTDVGMCGPYDSVLGVKKDIIIQRLWKQTKLKHEVDLGEKVVLNGLIFELDDQNKITTLERVYRVVKWR